MLCACYIKCTSKQQNKLGNIMQVFFNLTQSKKLARHVMPFLLSQTGVQVEDLMPTFKIVNVLVPVTNAEHAIRLRKEVERLCLFVNKKFAPSFFRCRKLDVNDVKALNPAGLTSSESVVFYNKAPKGVYRCIDV